MAKLMAQFDPVLNEHIRRIQNKETKVHYLSGAIQNEIITLVISTQNTWRDSEKSKEAIVKRVKKAKYFSVITDCAPDISPKEQLSIVLRIVTCELSVGISIAEHFFGFVDVEDTTGKGLSETLLGNLLKHSLIISNYQRYWKHCLHSKHLQWRRGTQRPCPLPKAYMMSWRPGVFCCAPWSGTMFCTRSTMWASCCKLQMFPWKHLEDKQRE